MDTRDESAKTQVRMDTGSISQQKMADTGCPGNSKVNSDVPFYNCFWQSVTLVQFCINMALRVEGRILFSAFISLPVFVCRPVCPSVHVPMSVCVQPAYANECLSACLSLPDNQPIYW